MRSHYSLESLCEALEVPSIGNYGSNLIGFIQAENKKSQSHVLCSNISDAWRKENAIDLLVSVKWRLLS
jgi:hypothetical protein